MTHAAPPPSLVGQIRHGLPLDGKLGGGAEYLMRDGFSWQQAFDSVVTVPWHP